MSAPMRGGRPRRSAALKVRHRAPVSPCRSVLSSSCSAMNEGESTMAMPVILVSLISVVAIAVAGSQALQAQQGGRRVVMRRIPAGEKTGCRQDDRARRMQNRFQRGRRQPQGTEIPAPGSARQRQSSKDGRPSRGRAPTISTTVPISSSRSPATTSPRFKGIGRYHAADRTRLLPVRSGKPRRLERQALHHRPRRRRLWRP